MRSGKWKLILPHKYRSFEGLEGRDDGIPVNYNYFTSGTELYDMSKDIGEQNDLAAGKPEVVERLLKKIARMRADLGDTLTKTKGSGRREPGRI